MRALIPVLVVSLYGCGTAAVSFEDTPDPAEYPVLIGRFADDPVSEPLVVHDAFIDDTEFYISYEGGGRLVFAGGNWSNRISVQDLEAADSDSYSGPYILPLQYQQPEPWLEIPEAPIRPRILDVEKWQRFRDELFLSVLPTEARSGVVMHFDTDDYFLFTNHDGNFEARLITDKPAEFQIVERIDFQDFMRRGLPELERFLSNEGVADRRILFETGDAGAYSLPFLYVNLDLPVAVFLRFAPSRRPPTPGASPDQVVQSFRHVAQSHSGSLVVRPLSSLFRLFFVATDAAVETVRPTWLATLETQPIPEIHDGPGMDVVEWESRLDRLTGRPTTHGKIEFLIDGDEYFTRLIDAITSANSSIDIRTYIFDNDDYAETIATLLRRRADEGVAVRVLLDGLGTILASGAVDESMPDDYVPPASVKRMLEEGSKVDVREAKNPWLAGDHVKTTIIDDRVAFTGGMNIGREYRYTWHDLMVEVHGPVVDTLRREFNKAWSHAGVLGDFGYFLERLKPGSRLSSDDGDPVRVLFTRPGNAEIFRAQLAAVRTARRYIYVEHAYLTDDAMLYELAKARRQGVDVRVILPLVGNHGPINKSNALAANAMLDHGIRVYLYPGMSHVKAAVFDGWACFGSANWDKLSFRVNRELNLATSHVPTVDKLLERLFAPDFAASVELTEPFPESWSDHLMEILADYAL